MAFASVTYSFLAGTFARAAEVNTNFLDLINHLNTTGVSVYEAGTVDTTALADNAVTLAKMADDSVGEDELIDGSVKLVALATEVTDKLDDTGQLLERDIRTSSGSLDVTALMTTYPTVKRIEVTCVGGGGGGGGCQATAVEEETMGSFGGGGGYAMRSIDIASLSASEAIVVGAGGTAGPYPGAAGTGGLSSFAAGEAYEVKATGGLGGNSMTSGKGFTSSTGGDGGARSGCAGDITSGGNAGENATRLHDNQGASNRSFIIPQGTSGDGIFGGAVRAPTPGNSGISGDGFGAGGSGGRNGGNEGSNRPGGAGSAGVVIIEVYS